MSRIANRRIVLLFFVVVALVAMACGGGTETLPTTLTVKQGDSTLAEWDAARIRAELELQQLAVGSTTYEGPLLTDLVAASGAADWGTLVAHGKGPNLTRDVAPLLLQGDAESKGYLVAINPDNTFRLVLPGSHDSQWVRRVRELTLPN